MRSQHLLRSASAASLCGQYSLRSGVDSPYQSCIPVHSLTAILVTWMYTPAFFQQVLVCIYIPFIVNACSRSSPGRPLPLLKKICPIHTVRRENSLFSVRRTCFCVRAESVRRLLSNARLAESRHVTIQGTAIFFSSAQPAMPSSADSDDTPTSTTSGGDSAYLSARANEPRQSGRI